MFRILLLMGIYILCTLAILKPELRPFKEVRKFIDSNVEKIESVLQENSDLKEEVSKQEIQIKNSREKTKSLSEQNRLLKEKTKSLSEQNRLLKEKIKSLSEQNRLLKEESLKQEIQIENLKKEVQYLQKSPPKQQSPPVDDDSHNKPSTDDPAIESSHQQTEGNSLGFLANNDRKSPNNARRSPCEVIVKNRLVYKRRKHCTDENRPIDQDRYPFEPRAKKRDPYRDVIIHDYRYYKQKKDMH